MPSLAHSDHCLPVQVLCRYLCPSNMSSLRGFFSISSSARSSRPKDDARLGGEAARETSEGAPEPRSWGSSSSKTWGAAGRLARSPASRPEPPPPGAYVAQPRGHGVSGGRPTRHVEHDDAIHDNERGNHHDENEVPEEPGVRDGAASLLPLSHRGPLVL